MSGYDTEALTEGQLGALIEIMFLAAFADASTARSERSWMSTATGLLIDFSGIVCSGIVGGCGRSGASTVLQAGHARALGAPRGSVFAPRLERRGGAERERSGAG